LANGRRIYIHFTISCARPGFTRHHLHRHRQRVRIQGATPIQRSARELLRTSGPVISNQSEFTPFPCRGGIRWSLGPYQFAGSQFFHLPRTRFGDSMGNTRRSANDQRRFVASTKSHTPFEGNAQASVSMPTKRVVIESCEDRPGGSLSIKLTVCRAIETSRGEPRVSSTGFLDFARNDRKIAAYPDRLRPGTGQNSRDDWNSFVEAAQKCARIVCFTRSFRSQYLCQQNQRRVSVWPGNSRVIQHRPLGELARENRRVISASLSRDAAPAFNHTTVGNPSMLTENCFRPIPPARGISRRTIR